MGPPSSSEEFGDILGRYLAETYTSVRRLETLSGVSRRTVENWLHGPVRRPRHWEPVLRVARALHLSATKTDVLLQAAGQPTLAVLRKAALTRIQSELLVMWPTPPGAAPSTPRWGNLPAQLTSFIGRADELAGLVEILAAPSPRSRLVTLTGEGGSGKTRLALQAAKALQPTFPDGLWLVELESQSHPALVPSAIGSALGLVEDKNRPPLDTLIGFLSGRRALLLLDNCEHLLDATAVVADKLLRHCPHLLILATSRERLGVAGETVCQVPEMALPPLAMTDQAQLAGYDAVRLFVERAAAALPGFTLTEDNAAAVAQICRRLDGIPLALELAAARVRLLRVEQIAARLDDRFALLTGGSRTASQRQQTLRGLIDWSYQLLSPSEQRLLRRLSVFPGGFMLAAAEAVCDVESQRTILDTLDTLADKSLVVASRTPGQEARYSLHETIRHYGREKLLAGDDVETIESRHAAYYCGLIEDALPCTDYDDRWFARLAWLEMEYGNWRAVLRRALDEGTVDATWGVRVAARLAPFWLMHGRLIEGRRWLQAALDRAEIAPPGVQATLYLWLATLMIREWDPQGAALAARGISLFRGLPDPTGIAWGLIVLSLSDLQLGKPAVAQVEESLARAVEAGDVCLQSGAHYVLARLALRAGSFDAAAIHGQQALVLARLAGNRLREPYLLRILGVIASWQGDSAQATTYYEEALELARELHVQGWVEAHILNSMGENARRQRIYDQALGYYREAQEVARRIGDMFLVMGENLNIGLVLVRENEVATGEALLRADMRERISQGRIDGNTIWNLWGLALVATRQGRLERAARLFGGAIQLSESTSFAVAPPDRAAFEADIAAVRDELGETTFIAAWEWGAKLRREQLLAFAMEE